MRVQRARARRGDAECGARPRYGSTSCDGNGRTARSTAAGDSPSSAARKNATSAHGLLEVAVARHDVEHDAVRLRVRRGGDKQRLGRRREARHRARRHVHAAARDRGLENRAKVQRGRGGHGLSTTVPESRQSASRAPVGSSLRPVGWIFR